MKPPATYGEWSVLLDDAVERFRDAEVSDALRSGTLETGTSSATRLLERIAEYENVVLKRLVKRLERELALAGDGGGEHLELLLKRFSRDCSRLLFFRGLTCLPAERVAELQRAVCDMVAQVFGDLRGHLERQLAAEDGLYLVARLETKWARGAVT